MSLRVATEVPIPGLDVPSIEGRIRATFADETGAPDSLRTSSARDGETGSQGGYDPRACPERVYDESEPDEVFRRLPFVAL